MQLAGSEPLQPESQTPGRRARGTLAALLVAATLILVLSSSGGAQEEPPTDDVPDRPSSTVGAAPDEEFVTGRLLVKTAGDKDLEATNRRLRARTGEELPALGIEVVEFSPSRPVEAVAAAYARDPAVEYAEPDFIRRPAATPPGDPLFHRQWNLHNTGGGRTAVGGADINALEAWTATTGTAPNVVAVVDTGVYTGHPDLRGRIWTNPGEVPGDGRDNDGNGYVDDVHGWDFANGDASVYDGVEGEEHGTHVAGIIAATANNGRGISGVAPGARIMPLKVCGEDQTCSSLAMINAFGYATARGVKVVNASLGGGQESRAERDAIEAARGKGVLFVFPAGNGGPDQVGDDADAAPFYPASYDGDNIISVAASDEGDGLADFSNFGVTSVDLAAPGAGVLSTALPRPTRVPVAVRVDGASIYAGFGLEQISTPAGRRSFLARALGGLETTVATPVLLVDDDGGADHEAYYEQALAALGFTDVATETVAPGADGPDTAAMSGKTVVWFTGATYTDTLRPADQAGLETHLGGGGKLLLMGQDLGYDIGGGRPRSTPTPFYRGRLGAVLVDDDYDPAAVAGMGDGPFGPDDRYELSGGDGASYTRYVDRLGYSATATAALLSVEENEAYATMSGTSMAAPHVAGTAALLRSHAPSVGYGTLKAAILGSAEKKPAFQGKTAAGGRLDAAAALEMLPPATTKLVLGASRKLVEYRGKTRLTGGLRGPSGKLAARRVEVWRSTDGGRSWKKDGLAAYDRTSGEYRASRTLTANTAFQFRFAGDAFFEAASSPRVGVRAKVRLSRPSTPARVRASRSFEVSGYLRPYQAGVTRLDFFRREGGRWRLEKSVKTRNFEYEGYTRYAARPALNRPGRWRVRAYHTGENHAATKSRPRHFTVR